MGNGKMNVGTVYMMDMETGELFKFDGVKFVDLHETSAPEHELEERVPDGISLYITGSDIDRVDSIEIRFKEGDK